MKKKRYIKPECSITEVRNVTSLCGSQLHVDRDENSSTGSGGVLSNKYRNNSWDNIWSN